MKDKPVILVVDDQPQNLELLEAYLVPQGYEIVRAANGEEALEKLSNQTIDLVLLDVMLPGMDGFEVIRRIRQENAHRLLPIILVTVLRETEDRVKGIEAGCDDFISTPVDRLELLARVRSLLKVKSYNDLMSSYREDLESEVIRRTEELRHALENLQLDITERRKVEEALRASLLEKEVLLREIHHRVKNNMQVICSLFNLQSGHTTNEECRAILKEGQTRIRSMSLVHEKLYQSRDLSKIDLAAYIQSLADHLFQVYLVNPAQVRMETELEEAALDINSAIPCGLILNELISNVLKHAFPEGRTGVIKIGLKRGCGDAIELRVADDGIGLPEGLNFRTAESFGLQIVNLLVDQLEAAIDLDRTKGTAFIIVFRESKYALRI